MGSCWAHILDCIKGLVMLRDTSSLTGSYCNPGCLLSIRRILYWLLKKMHGEKRQDPSPPNTYHLVSETDIQILFSEGTTCTSMGKESQKSLKPRMNHFSWKMKSKKHSAQRHLIAQMLCCLWRGCAQISPGCCPLLGVHCRMGSASVCGGCLWWWERPYPVMKR